MGTYATRDEMIARYGEDAIRRLTDRQKVLGAIDDTTLFAAMDAANSRVAGAVMAGGYTYGFADPLLTAHACTIAYWSLFTGERTQDLTDSYNAAIADLNAIARRTLVLAVTSADTPAPASIQGGIRTLPFSGSTLSGYTGVRSVWP